MTFTDLPLRDAVTLFNRRNATQLVLADAALGERKIGGAFAADQVEAFVRLLADDGEVAVVRRDATEIVLRRAP
jgi:ferric-dicitrate binding protein FerR (iron transport regulator)